VPGLDNRQLSYTLRAALGSSLNIITASGFSRTHRSPVGGHSRGCVPTVMRRSGEKRWSRSAHQRIRRYRQWMKDEGTRDDWQQSLKSAVLITVIDAEGKRTSESQKTGLADLRPDLFVGRHFTCRREASLGRREMLHRDRDIAPTMSNR